VTRLSQALALLRRNLWRLVLVVVLVALPAILIRIDAVRAELTAMVKTMREAGAAGVAMLLAFDIVGAVITLPTWALSGIAGYVFGFWAGLAIALPFIAIAASVTFLLGRRFARHWFALGEPRADESRPRRMLRAVQGAVEEHGFKVTLLLRLTFVLPQNFLGYFLGTTRLRLRDFFGGTLFGLVPATLAHVYVGSIVEDISKLLSDSDASLGGPAKIGIVAGGIVLAAGGLYGVARFARRALERTIATAPAAPTPQD